MQHVTRLSDDLARFVSIDACRPLVPGEHPSVQILGDHAVFGGALEQVLEELVSLHEIVVGSLELGLNFAKFGNVSGDGRHPEELRGLRIADHEELFGDRDRLLGLPVPEVRLTFPVALLVHCLESCSRAKAR